MKENDGKEEQVKKKKDEDSLSDEEKLHPYEIMPHVWGGIPPSFN